MESWLGRLAPWAREHELGRVDDLMGAAAHGELLDTGDAVTPIKPIRRDPEIFEIRHTALAKKVRFYHGEPHELPVYLVALHRHFKVDNAQQEMHVQFAATRYVDGRSALWNTP